MNKGWQAFFMSILIGILIAYGLYLVTKSLLVSIILGLGIYGVIYFICVGLAVIANAVTDIRNHLLKKD